MKKCFFLIPLVIATGFIAGCRTELENCADFTARSPFVLGVVMPLSGDNAVEGRNTLNGIRMAVTELNRGRGFSGLRIELDVRDNESTGTGSAKATEALIKDGANALILGFTTNEVLEAAKILQRHRIPAITPTATNDDLHNAKKLLFRVPFSDRIQGQALAAYVKKWRGYDRMAIVVNLDAGNGGEYSRAIAASASQAFADLGGIVVEAAKYKGNVDEFSIDIKKMLACDPQAILVAANAFYGGKVVKYIRSLGYNGLIVGPDYWDEPVFITECDGNPGDCAFTSLYSEELATREQIEFRKKYRNEHFVFPGSDAASGYDAVKLLSSITAYASDCETCMKNLRLLRAVPGASAVYTFEKDGSLIRNVYIKTVRPPSYAGGAPEVKLSQNFMTKRLEELLGESTENRRREQEAAQDER